eukprot:gb/GECG01009941.1/.p1 GENE.gb/GECG01009941.1/~~gb/GECG01009941.1/.p1  ORF type:complete len:955 (+),score=162.03 gb/GECG01009941.1/:1-2865(+)
MRMLVFLSRTGARGRERRVLPTPCIRIDALCRPFHSHGALFASNKSSIGSLFSDRKENQKDSSSHSQKSKKSLAEKLFADDSKSRNRPKGGPNKPLIDQEAFNRMRSEFAELRKLREQQQQQQQHEGGGKQRKAYGKTNWGSLAYENRRANSEGASSRPMREADRKREHYRKISETRRKARGRVFDKMEREQQESAVGTGGEYGGDKRGKRATRKPSQQGQQARRGRITKRRATRLSPKDIPVIIRDSQISVADLAYAMRRRVRMVQKKLTDLGEESEQTTMLDPDTAELIAQDFGHPVKRYDFQDIAPLTHAEKRQKIAENENMPPKPPVVAVLGHVDHGKTTLLDVLRSTNSAGNEAGGITQVVSSFMVDVEQDFIPGEELYSQKNSKEQPSAKKKKAKKKKKQKGSVGGGNLITFIDTPGHSLFSKMRSSGASATDFVTLVVAAEDGVMPQTQEAVEMCLNRDPPIPIVVAVTKVDRFPNTDEAIDRISKQLMNIGLQTDHSGGSTPIVPISAMSGDGIQELKEMILLQAEEMELKADLDDRVEAHILESRVVKGLGPVADAVVQWGTVKPRDYVVVGSQYCRVRSLMDTNNQPLKEAKPGTPVRIGTFDDTVSANDVILGVADEETASRIAEKRARKAEISRLLEEGKELDEKKRAEMELQKQRKRKEQDIALLQQRARRRKAIESKGLEVPEHLQPQKWEKDLEDELLRKAYETGGSFEDVVGQGVGVGEPQVQTVPVIVRADSNGSLESLCDALEQLPQDEVKVQVVRKDVGSLSEADIEYSKDTGALLFTFNVKVPTSLERKADKEGIAIHEHNIIYKFIEDMANTLSDFLPPEEEKEIIGKAEVSQVFKLNTTGAGKTPETVAGCRVQSGVLQRNAMYQLERGGEIIQEFDSALSLRRFKEPVERIEKGQECGVALGEKFTDFQAGDILTAFTKKSVKRSIATPFS